MSLSVIAGDLEADSPLDLSTATSATSTDPRHDPNVTYDLIEGHLPPPGLSVLPGETGDQTPHTRQGSSRHIDNIIVDIVNTVPGILTVISLTYWHLPAMSTIFDHNGGKNVYHFYSVVGVVYQISSLPYLYDPRAPGNALPAEQRTLVYCTRYRFGTKFLPFDGIFIVEIFQKNSGIRRDQR